MTERTTTLKRALGSFRLWGIAVGLVISEEYLGWSYGWSQASTTGFMVVALAVATMYCTSIFSSAGLITAIPHVGDPSACTYRIFGPTSGFIAGFTTLTEFVFAPSVIAVVIGAYLNVQFPALDPKWAACGAYVISMTLSILSIGIATTFELTVILLVIFELLVFMDVTTPGSPWNHFTTNGWAGAESSNSLALPGMLAAILFAIRFFLAIEGVSMVVEEAKDSQRAIPRALGGDILTLTVLAIGVMAFAGDIGDWRALSNINNLLPQAMEAAVSNGNGWLHMLVWLGLFSLVASFYGTTVGYSRQIYSLARAGYLSVGLATLNCRIHAPHLTVLVGGMVGTAAIFFDSLITINGISPTTCVVIMSVFGAIIMYVTSMAVLFRLRRNELKLIRPFRVPLYPLVPAFALGMTALCLVAMAWYNLPLALIFMAMMLGGYLRFCKTATTRERAPVDPQLCAVP